MLLFVVGVCSSWADEVTLGNQTTKPISGSNSISVTGTLTDSGNKSWSVSLTGTDEAKNPSQSVYTGTTYWQLGANGNMTTAVFSTSAIPGTITKIVVNCAAYQGKGTANVTVGGSAFGTQDQAIPAWSNNTGGNLTFTGSASGEIKVTLAPSTGGRAIYLSSITVTYVAGNPKKVTYSDGGSDTEANVGAGVTLPTREDVGDYSFQGWSIANIASETTTAPTILRGTYKPTQDITLYPVYSRVDGIDGNPSVIISEYATANSWQGSGAQAYTSITLDDNITVTTTGTGNNGKYYSDWRLYQNGNGNAIVTAQNGALLKSATFTFTVSNTGALLYNGNAITSGTAVQLNGPSATFTVGNSGSATNGQVRITEIVVEYAIGTTYYISTPLVPTPAKTINFAGCDSKAYYTTFSNTKAVTFPEMIEIDGEYAQFTVYTVSVLDGQILLNECTNNLIEDKWYLTENEGYLIKAEYSQDPVYTGDVVISVPYEELDYGLNSHDADNNLRPSGNGITAADMEAGASNSKFYRLTMHNEKTLGFWWGAANGAAFNLSANKAYLVAPNSTESAKMNLWFKEELPTAINGIEATKSSTIYNLQGLRINRLQQGVNIVNGRKVIR